MNYLCYFFCFSTLYYKDKFISFLGCFDSNISRVLLPIVIKHGYVKDKEILFAFNCSKDSMEYIVPADYMEIAKEAFYKADTSITLEPWNAKIFMMD